MRHSKKKKVKKDPSGGPATLAALAKFTSSNVIHQVKIGMNKIAPLDTDGDVPDLEEPIE